MIIEIVKVEQKQSPKGTTFYRVESKEGTWYSVWKPEMFPFLIVGKQLDATTEQKGNFWNITEIKITELKPEVKQPIVPLPASQTAPKDTPKPYSQTMYQDTKISIEGQVALKELGECLRAGTFKNEEIAKEAGVMYWRIIKKKLSEWEREPKALEI